MTRFSAAQAAKSRRQQRRRDQPEIARSAGPATAPAAGRAAGAEDAGWRTLPRLTLGWLVVVTAVVAWQPIATADFWWELSRGRGWLDGPWVTSRLLLTQETYADADWLGPGLLYFPYRLMGLGGMPVMRMLAVVGTAWASWRLADGVAPTRRALFVSALLITATPAFDPGPLLWDFCALLALAWITHRGRGFGLAAAIGCLLLWANTAPRVILGVIALCLFAVRIAGPQLAESVQRRAWRRAGQPLVRVVSTIILAVVATSLTPRGSATLRDSFRLSFPAWSAADVGLDQGPWAAVFPLLSETASSSAVQVGGWLALAWLSIEAWSRRERALATAALVVSAWFVLQLIVWQCVGNLAMTGPLLLIVFGFPEPDISESAEGRSATERPLGGWDRHSTTGRKVVLATTSLILAIAVSGLIRRPHGSGGGGGLGFGFVERLDVRFLERAIGAKRLEGGVFADSLTTAGMAAWAGGGLQLWDSPQRAQVGGRWREYRLLSADLRTGHRAAYQRSDGSEGGWWLPLSRNDTRMLLVDARRTQLFRSLASSIWRPLAIDGPVIPLARAGDPAFNDDILLAMRMQDFVDSGRWEYQPPGSTASLFDRDGFGFWVPPVDLSEAYRQADLLRAFGLPRAALSVLRRLRQDARSDRLATAIALCHADLLEEEIRQAGRPSDFRAAVWQQVGQSLPTATRSTTASVPAVAAEGGAFDRRLESAATRYLADQPDAALAELADRAGSQYRYARAVIWLESGAIDPAEAELKWLLAEPTDLTISILARSMLKRIAASRAAG